MESTYFQQDDHQQQHYHHHHHQHQQQPPAYPGAGLYSSSLRHDQQHLSYGVSPPPPQQQQQQPSSTLSTNQVSYSYTDGEVLSASSGVTCDASSFSHHSLSSNTDFHITSPNFLSKFLGILHSPNDSNLQANAWLRHGGCNNPPLASATSFNNSFSTASVLGQMGSASSHFLGLNLQALDFLNSSSLGGIRQCSGYGDTLALSGKEPQGLSWPSTSRSRALESSRCSSNQSSKASALVNNGVAGNKRPAGGNYSNTSSNASSIAVSSKKSSLKTSCPPFKVRKEKLGDRIAALHQLVSPFGKTDTASVLTEAIGYIQFLQDQIHTLCMPNVQPLRNKPCSRIMQTVSSEDQQQSRETGAIQDLRKRGLCLVPLSWISFITADQLDASINHQYHYF